MRMLKHRERSYLPKVIQLASNRTEPSFKDSGVTHFTVLCGVTHFSVLCCVERCIRSDNRAWGVTDVRLRDKKSRVTIRVLDRG